MKLYRFIGKKELDSVLQGEKQFNNFDWSVCCDTTSKGICFFAYNRTNNIDHIVDTVLNGWGFAGIVKDYAIIEIEVDKARKAKGFYSSGYHTEYNLFEYDISKVKNAWLIPHNNFVYNNKKYSLYNPNEKAENIFTRG